MNWDLVPLEDVATIDRESICPSEISNHTLYVGLEHIESGGKFLGGKKVENGELASNKFKFSPEHILFGKLRPYLAKVALPGVFGICSTDILPIRAKKDLNIKFLRYLLLHPKYVAIANSLSTGANLPRISPNALAKLEIPLPPLDEQRRIAKILDLTNQSKESYLKRKSLLLKSIFSYLGEVTRDCTSNNWNWNLIPLKEVATSKLSNGIFKKNHQYLKTKEGLPVVWVKNLFTDYAINTNECPYINVNNKEVNQFSLEYGDILFCRSSLKREGIAFPNIYLGDSGNALFECHTIRLRVDQKKINPVFLNLWLRTNFMRKIAISESKTSTMTTIDQQGVLRLPVILPPMNIQNKISNIYFICRELSAKLDSISQLNKEFSSSLYSSLIR